MGKESSYKFGTQLDKKGIYNSCLRAYLYKRWNRTKNLSVSLEDGHADKSIIFFVSVYVKAGC